jgi:alpha-1,3-mannosyltransferase
MKILHVSYNFYPVTGGVERNIEDICRGLAELGHQSDVCCVRVPGTSAEEIHNGIRIRRVKAINAKFYKIAPGALRAAVGYDIVHVHGLGFFSDFLGLSKKLHGKRLVLSTHGGIFHTDRLSFLKKLYFNLWSRLVLRFYDAVVAVSYSDKELFSSISRNVATITNSIDYAGLSKIMRRPENNLLVFVGRLSSNKRIDNLIRTVAEAKRLGTELKLVVIGEDWDGLMPQWKDLSRRLGVGSSIIFTGRISREAILRYLGRARAFVSASEYEGFGISVLEAMGAGVPVIVNDIDAFKTFVVDGKNGFITDFSDPGASAARIISIIKKRDLIRISANAKTTAKGYDYMKIARRIEKLYQAIPKTSS